VIGDPPSDDGATQVILTLKFEFKRVLGLARPAVPPAALITTADESEPNPAKLRALT
jgi:hypothetical protein